MQKLMVFLSGLFLCGSLLIKELDAFQKQVPVPSYASGRVRRSGQLYQIQADLRYYFKEKENNKKRE